MMCDFNTGFQPPENVKRRPVITLSRRRQDNAPLCTVIPISSTAPEVVRDFHYKLPDGELPHFLRGNYAESWIKIDMIQTVAFFRLTLLWNGRDLHGDRRYDTSFIGREHRIEITKRILSRLSLVDLDEL